MPARVMSLSSSPRSGHTPRQMRQTSNLDASAASDQHGSVVRAGHACSFPWLRNTGTGKAVDYPNITKGSGVSKKTEG